MFDVLDQLFVKTWIAMFPFLPSYWLTTSVLQWTEGVLTAAGFFFLVLLSHTLFFGGLAFMRWGNLFYETASVVQSRPSVWRESKKFGAWRARGRAHARLRVPVAGRARRLR